MGKGVNLINGVISGKVGAQVGYKTQDSKRPQGVRAYQPSVSNPRSYAQAKQRAKLTPAQTFYDRFEPILNHAFLPKGKSSLNRRRFLSLAMKEQTIPYVTKGSSWLPFNVPYQVSEGNLPLDSLCVTSRNDDGYVLDFAALKSMAVVAQSTVAAFSQDLLQYNSQLVEGMELTFMGIAVNEANYSDQRALYGSVVLNTKDSLTTLSQCLGALYVKSDVAGCLSMSVNQTVLSGFNLVAGALIISSRTATSWRYTNSFLGMTAYGLDGFDVDAETVIRSYMNGGSDASSDLILQQADNGLDDSTVRIVSVANETYTPSPAVTGATYSKDKAAVATYSNGARKVVLNGDRLVNLDNGVYSGITVTVDTVTSQLIVDETTWDSAPSVQLADVQAAGF